MCVETLSMQYRTTFPEMTDLLEFGFFSVVFACLVSWIKNKFLSYD